MGTKSFRLNKMDQYIMERKMVTVEELSNNFGLSLNTVRSDIMELEKMNRIQKVYGGACSRHSSRLQTFEERSRILIRHKKDIASEAVKVVNKGDTIFIDSGTTAMYLVDFLEENKNITIITHNLGVIMRAIKKPGIRLVCLPGELDRSTNSFIAEDMQSVLRNYHIDKAFISTAGISANGEVTTQFPLEYMMKQEVLKCNCETFLLTDASKFGKATDISFSCLEEFDQIIIDCEVEEIFLKLCNTKNVPVIVANRREDVHISSL